MAWHEAGMVAFISRGGITKIFFFAKAFHNEGMKERSEALVFPMRLFIPSSEEFLLRLPNSVSAAQYVQLARHAYQPPCSELHTCI